MNCGDSKIDGLLGGNRSAAAIVPGEKSLAVEYLQDLLRGQGYSLMHDPRSPGYGVYDTGTSIAVEDYRKKHGLGGSEDPVDTVMLRDLVARPAVRAGVGPAYVPLVLDAAFSSVLRFVWLTSLFETGGFFGRLNLNTDGCGVSFGILQWSQKPGQLHHFLNVCATREPAEWARIMGDRGQDLLAYMARPNGGLDARGQALDASFELTRDPWKSRLQALGQSLPVQRVQLDLAEEVYTAELKHATTYAAADTSERGFAFLLDLANQFGPGRVAQQYKLAAQSGTTEGEILKAMEDAFTAIARTQFRQQVRARREFFRTTGLLSDAPMGRA